MKLSKIYSSQPQIFEDINFSTGLNIVLAEIRDKHSKSKDTHNLGKTTLGRLIDFLLLKSIDKDFFLLKKKDVFESFVFFLEIKTCSGEYITIRRPVTNNTKISFKKHDIENQNFRDFPSDQWTHHEVAFDKAKEMLSGYLSLSAISSWNYRQGASYFLRMEKDFFDIFQLSKFKNKHIEWKPYLAHILGYDGSTIRKNYEFSQKISMLEAEVQLLESSLPEYASNIDTLNGVIFIAEEEIRAISNRLDSFDFYIEETDLNIQLVNQIEDEIAALNQRRYVLHGEIKNIEDAISQKISFSTKQTKKIFEDAQIYFGGQIVKEYSELEAFNRKLHKQRSKYLGEQLSDLKVDLSKVENSLKNQNDRRKEIVNVLDSKDFLEKYKILQGELVNKNSSLADKKVRLSTLEIIADKKQELQSYEELKKRTVDFISTQIRNQKNDIYSSIRSKFNDIIKKVLNKNAIISTQMNKNNNIDFNADIRNSDGDKTSETEGFSYQKLLCIAFDLSVLATYSKKDFFHFVYHDSVFDALDHRKSLQLLELLREYAQSFDLQIIITTTDTAWPEDTSSIKADYGSGEIKKVLHDQGIDGLLFKMPPW